MSAPFEELLSLEDGTGAFDEESVEESPGMSEEDVKSAIGAELQDAREIIEGDVGERRRLAQSYYKGDLFGNEVEGRSSVVLTPVADTIDWIMPSLMRILFGGHEVAKYNPVAEGDEAGAEQATDYCNHVFMQENNGFKIGHTLCKDALLEGLGVGRVYYEDKLEPIYSRLESVSAEEFALMQEDDPSLEIIESSPSPDVVPAPLPPPGANGAEAPPPPAPVERFDVKVKTIRKTNRIRVRAIAPENFLMARRHAELDEETPFCAERSKLTRSDLVAMGFSREQVETIPSHGDMAEMTSANVERYEDEQPTYSDDFRTGAMQTVWVYDGFIRLDVDGDGLAELRHFIAGGENAEVLLVDEPASWVSFFDLCPILMSHKFHGRSVADLVMDLQRIQSTILRQILDNMYLTNNARTIAVEGQVEIDDLLVSRPGGVIRVQQLDAVGPFVTPALGPMAQNTLDYIDGVKESRTGMSRASQGLDASTLRNTTATGISQLMSAAQMRVDLIVRIFAECGLKRMFKLILREMVERPLKKRVLRLRNQWVPVDATKWNAEMDCTIQLGLGVGQATERIEFLGRILELQARAVEMGGMGTLVELDNLYNATREMTRAMGFKIDNQFFTNPAGKQPAPPKPDPLLVEAEANAKEGEAKVRLEMAKLEFESQQAAAELDFKRYECEKRAELEREKIESQERIALANASTKERVARKKPAKAAA